MKCRHPDRLTADSLIFTLQFSNHSRGPFLYILVLILFLLVSAPSFAGCELISLAIEDEVETPEGAGDKEAWRDCMRLCLIGAIWPPAVSAWAVGCTAGYLIDDACQRSSIRRNAALQGVTYVPRFDPVVDYTFANQCNPSEAPGEELLLVPPGQLNPSVTIQLSAGRYDSQSAEFITGEGNVADVQFYAVEYTDLNAAASYDSAPWIHLGPGVYDGAASRWNMSWNFDLSSFPVVLGYALRVDFNDGILGTLQGVNSIALTSLLFCDGFEAGNTDAWSNVLP